mmetsp:Transcript_25229/g.80167  ORF Transcript_25229/g.80167 Transcript_25229/m.80167 type:complete len:232 (-) Transcript_25229:2246-2941(-)
MHSTLAWRMQAHQRACTQTPRPDARTHQPHTGVPAARSGAGRPQRNWGCLAPPDRRGICTICTPGANGCCICTTCPWELYTGAAICGPAAIIAAGTAVWTGAATGTIGSATGGGASVRTSASTSAASIAAGAPANSAGSPFDFFALLFFFFFFFFLSEAPSSCSPSPPRFPSVRVSACILCSSSSAFLFIIVPLNLARELSASKMRSFLNGGASVRASRLARTWSAVSSAA